MRVRRLDSGGEPVFGQVTSVLPDGSAAVATLLVERLKLLKEEWFLDRTAGVAWVDLGSGEPRVFGASADSQFLEAEVKRVILSTDGVSALASFAMTFDHETRRAVVTADVADVYGNLIPLEVILP